MGCLQLFEIITSGRHFWPGHPPFIRDLHVSGCCTGGDFLSDGHFRDLVNSAKLERAAEHVVIDSARKVIRMAICAVPGIFCI